MTNRCAWVTEEPLYIDYHDHEWGKPLYNDQKLFEMLCLEGAQAGLSWWTILQRREAYRQAFDGFDPVKIAQYSEEKIEQLIKNDKIIRNRLKINSVVTNAQAYLKITEGGQNFSSYIWSYVEGKQIVNHWTSPDEVPAATDLSTKMSKKMKKDGFKFVGPTICYAYMQAVGMVNDHLLTCAYYEESSQPRV